MGQAQPAHEDDLAYVHDAGFSGFAEGSAPGLLDILRRAGIADGLVVDLGCGSGIWARHLTDAGYRVVGVDLSPAMLRLARRRAPRARFHAASWRTFPLPACRAITALGEVLCYQFDAAADGDALPGLLRRAFAALEPGGLLVFDVAEVGLGRNRPPTFREGADWACLVRNEYDDGREQLVRHITTFRKAGAHYRRHEESHRVQLRRGSDVTELLRDAGFRVRTVRRYGAYGLLPRRLGFIARRPR